MKTVVAMSGGVDSSVSAALLTQAGHDVTGAFIKVWQPPFLECDWETDRQDAKRVAATLGIKFETVDLADAYKREVVDYMVRSYEEGETPNPDVMCNQSVKFGAFLHWAKKQGFEAIATGHYAQVINGAEGYELHKGLDEGKDQSYFLWTLGQDALAMTQFPVGDKKKSMTRSLAEKFELSVATKKDSQGLCFIGKLDMKDFLKQLTTGAEGIVLNENKEAVGRHDGALFYTLGQRHGFTVSAGNPNQKPLYVIDKDIKANTITVTDNLDSVTEKYTRNEITLRDSNWIPKPPEVGSQVEGRFRYQQQLFTCTISDISDTTATISLDTALSAVPPGQSLVLYDGTRCLGGGIITS